MKLLFDQNLSFKLWKRFSAITAKPSPPLSRTPPRPAWKFSDSGFLLSASLYLITDHRLLTPDHGPPPCPFSVSAFPLLVP
jgi:hypothetical protein